MQRRKILAAVFTLLLVGIIAPASIPRGHADDNNITISSTGYVVKQYFDPYLGRTVDAIKAGSTLSITVVFYASNAVFQRNVSLGIKFDWMNTYQNSSMANSQSPFSIYANQIVYLTLNYTVPNLTGQYAGLNLGTHSWEVQVWDTQSGKTAGPFCFFDNGFQSCTAFFSNFPVAIYSTTQASAVQARQQASALITALSASLRSVFQAPPGSSQAVASLAQASAQMSLGDTAYQNGDFNTANTDYQNALNNANAAQSSLSFTGGGTDTATLTHTWIEAVAILLAGIASFLVGFAGFKYIRTRTKNLTTYTPAPTTAKP